MIKKLNFIASLILAGFIITGCVKDGVDECPPGNVRLHFFVERFQNRSQNPLDDREDVFGDIVKHFRYYLYKDGSLIRQGIVEDFTRSATNSYTMEYTDLEYGDYEMIVVTNSTKDALIGDGSDPSQLMITYPGCDDTEDYFTAVFPFSVASDQAMDYEIGLMRAHGVIRYTFKNIPENVRDMEIIMENVAQEKWVKGDYKNVCKASRKYEIIPLTRQAAMDGYVMGTFPTLTDDHSAFHLNIYTDNREEPYRRELISGDLSILRNQLLDLEVTFNDGIISFEILLDSTWDGSSPGGSTEIQ